MNRMWCAALGLAGVLAPAVPAQTAAVEPAALPQQSYAIDQTRYFASPEVEQAELAQRLAELAALPPTAPGKPAALLVYLHRAEALLAQLERHKAYLHLRASRDLDDRADADAADRAADAIDRLHTAVGAALRGLGAAALSRDAAAYPALKPYAFLLSQAERELPHELPWPQQTVIDQLADPAAANLWTLYQQTVRSTPFAKIGTAEGARDAKQDARLLALDPDRGIRQAAWQARWDGYAARADLYAGILLGVVRLGDRVAHLQKFPDAPSRVYFSRELDRKDVSAALAAIESHAEVFKDYQRLRARHIAAMTGIAEVRSWDWSLPAPGFAVPRMTLEQTSAAALAALAPLGADYVEHFRQLLDPANGRMDVAMEQGKRANGGFSVGAPGVPTGLFVENYGSGLIGDSRVVIHEGGHAIHRQLMNERGVSPFYLRGPNWMFEAFATLNEFLLYDHLYQTSTDPKARAYYLEALIDDIGFQLFGSAEEGTLEQSIYDGAAAGSIRNAADLDALTLSIWDRYEIWPALEPELAHTWMSKSLMVEDPLYLVNYLYSGLLATKMFDLAQRDPSAFQQRYADLLGKGFYAPPRELLRGFFGRDLSQQELVDDGMSILQQRIQDLAEIYREIDGPAAGSSAGPVPEAKPEGQPDPGSALNTPRPARAR